jgi:hypothetical protein
VGQCYALVNSNTAHRSQYLNSVFIASNVTMHDEEDVFAVPVFVRRYDRKQ